MKKEILISSVLFLLYSCTYIIHPKARAKVNGATSSSEITLLPSGSNPEKVIVKDATKPIDMTFSSVESFYLITQEKEGFVKQYNVVIPTKFNPVKLLDAVISVAWITAAIVIRGDNEDPTLNLYAAAIGILWMNGVWSPSKTYDVKFSLPEMTPYVKRKEDQRYLYIYNMGLNIESEDFVVNYYKNWKKFQAGTAVAGARETLRESVSYDNTIFTEGMNEVLTNCDFTDTTRKIFSTSYNSYLLEATIKKIEYNVIYYKMQNSTMTIDWQLKDYMSRETVAKYSTTETSDFIPLGDDYIKDGIVNCLEKSMFQLLELPDFQLKMKTVDNKEVEKKWDLITIKNKGKNPTDLPSFVKASLIIKLKEGHGSGIVISEDGYALSNYHVVGNNDSVEVIFSDGKSTNAKVIRSNPKYDLALIKISGKSFAPPLVDVNITNEIATEVVAIGTPTDIELGQTITKGIISGFRKNDDHNLIQTDAKVSPGNSGGALINVSNGQLVGVVNAKIIGFGIEGIAFAIPVSIIESALKIKFN